MTKQFLTCQLPGCTRVIAISPDEPTPRKYCCAEHRVAARRLRHEVLAGTGTSDADPLPPAPIADAPQPVPRPRPTPSALASTSTAISERARQGAELGRRGAQRGIELGQQSAQRGIELGKLGAQRGAELSRVTFTVLLAGCQYCRQQLGYWLAEMRTGWREATPRQRRSTVLTGIIAIMLTGSGWIAVLASGSGSSPTQLATPATNSVSAPKGMAAWAQQATVDLTAVQGQLAEVAKGESAWSALPASAKTSDLATSYAQLEQQKGLLQQEQTMLQTGLNAVTNVHQTGATLDSVEGQLHSVSTMIDGMAPADQRDIAETAIHGQLLQQQEVLEQECNTLHQELTGWVAAVSAAVATGLPGSTDTTIGTVNLILAASQQTPPAPPAPAPAPTVILADGPAARPRHVVTSSAPPHHHGSSSSSSQGGTASVSIPGIGDLSSLQQIAFGIVHNVMG